MPDAGFVRVPRNPAGTHEPSGSWLPIARFRGRARRSGRDRTDGQVCVTPPRYVACRQAPTPADGTGPIGPAGPEGTYEARGANCRAPGIQPGMAAHAPKQDRWWRGREPGAEHRLAGPVFALLRAQDMEGRPELPVRPTGQSCSVLSLTSPGGGSSMSMTWPSLATLVCR